MNVPGGTGTLSSDLGQKAKAAREALETHDFVFLHVKGTDNAGHDGKLEEKVMMIEKIDKMVGMLMDMDIHIAITADHSTPVRIGGHSAHPVPVLMHGRDLRIDKVDKFDEISCARGGLGQIRGLDFMPILSELMGFSHVYGS